MIQVELRKELERLNVHKRYYAIEGELKDNAFNIELMQDGTYAVYLLERGEKCGLRIFEKEEEATEDLLKSIKFDLKYGADLSQ